MKALFLFLNYQTAKLELLEIKTINEPGANADATADITICHLLPNCCDIITLDDPDVDNWEQGALDSYRGNLLQGCDGFLLPENGNVGGFYNE